MSADISVHAVVVSKDSFNSNTVRRIVDSNISFINVLFEEQFLESEISVNALRSYYIDYYLAQVNNGGFSQFVFNSRWSQSCVRLVRDGLQAIGAVRHLALFQEGEALVVRLADERLQAFLESDYFGKNVQRDELNVLNGRFFQLKETEDLVALNAAWLRRLPDLVVLDIHEMEAEIKRRVQSIANREQRFAAVRGNAPRYRSLIEALCERSGQVLCRMLASDTSHVHNGVETTAWYFTTDRGPHYMLEVGGRAVMFDKESQAVACELSPQMVGVIAPD